MLLCDIPNLQFPGPGEAGLAYMVSQMRKFPMAEHGWHGPFECVVSLNHSQCVKPILQTSGS